ncbi:MAG: ferritin family protein [Spirochaetales bacterium]|nr:ferritin family protein [Spirochaetales bacterium]MCF7938958.1 ferritin family protein [Spirochaetales bacterium]
MAKDNIELDILKKAILLEQQGKALYEQVAQSTSSRGAGEVFSIMAKEETKHIEYLSKHFASVREKGAFLETDDYGKPDESFADVVLEEEIIRQISASGFEAAAISAAIEMEKKAVSLYEKGAADTSDENAAGLYRTLADWERTHLDFLVEMDRELTEDIWNENSFWPF